MKPSFCRYVTVPLLILCILTLARSHVDVPVVQDVLGDSVDINLMRLTVHGKASIRKTAEVSVVDFAIMAQAASAEEATAKVQSSVQNMESSLNAIQKDIGGSDDAGAEHVYTTFFAQSRGSMKFLESTQGEFYSEARLTARFGSVSRLNHFIQDLIDDSSVEVNWLEWKLSEKTLASIKHELRLAAVSDATQNGKTWAQTLEQEFIEMEEIEDTQLWSESKTNRVIRTGAYKANEDISAPEIEVHQSVKCVFKL